MVHSWGDPGKTRSHGPGEGTKRRKESQSNAKKRAKCRIKKRKQNKQQNGRKKEREIMARESAPGKVPGSRTKPDTPRKNFKKGDLGINGGTGFSGFWVSGGKKRTRGENNGRKTPSIHNPGGTIEEKGRGKKILRRGPNGNIF